MSEPTVLVALTEQEAEMLMMALYSNLDTSFEPTLRRVDALHVRLGTAVKALRLREEARRLESTVAERVSA